MRTSKPVKLLNYYTTKKEKVEEDAPGHDFMDFLENARLELNAIASSEATTSKQKCTQVIYSANNGGGSRDWREPHDVDFGNPVVSNPNGCRRFSIPVVFRIVEAGKCFWDIKPSQIARELICILQKDVVHQRLSRRGHLTVRVATIDAAIKLLDVKTLGGTSVEASIPDSLLKNEGRIKSVPFRFTEKHIFEKLEHLGVVCVRRQFTTRKTDGVGATTIPRGVVVLTFKPEVVLPETVTIGSFKFAVEEYLEPPLQCRKCLRYGHITRICRGVVRCRNCAGAHEHKDCTAKALCCANCYGPHRATFHGCLKRRDAAFAQRIRQFQQEEQAD